MRKTTCHTLLFLLFVLVTGANISAQKHLKTNYLIEMDTVLNLKINNTYHKEGTHSGAGYYESLIIHIVDTIKIEFGKKYLIPSNGEIFNLNYTYFTHYNWRSGKGLPNPTFSGYIIFNELSETTVSVSMNVKVKGAKDGTKTRRFKGDKTFMIED